MSHAVSIPDSALLHSQLQTGFLALLTVFLRVISSELAKNLESVQSVWFTSVVWYTCPRRAIYSKHMSMPTGSTMSTPTHNNANLLWLY